MDVFGALAALADDVTRDIPDETCLASCPGPVLRGLWLSSRSRWSTDRSIAKFYLWKYGLL
eukprot:SAG11_NODE_24733_length_368_cov_37.185874_1_plen_60_part_01